jgi:hypothetical protein
MKPIKYELLTAAFAATAALLSWSNHAQAYSEGISNRSVSGCLGIVPSCHNSAMARNDGAMVRVDGPMTVNAGERVTYTMHIARTDMGRLFGGGLNVRVSAGALGSNAMFPMTKLLDCELTHRGIIAANAGLNEVIIPFDFIAPSMSATVQLSAAGNGVDGNSTMGAENGQTGDQWGTTTLAINVVGDAAPGTGGQCPAPVDAGPEPTVEPGPEGGVSMDASDGSTGPDSGDVSSERAVIGIDVPSSDVVVDGGPMMARGGCQCSVGVASESSGAFGGRRSPWFALATGVSMLCFTRQKRRSRDARTRRS